jgi:hypothetical protein
VTKDFILSEIRRVTSQLGRPPGAAEFLGQTGIKEWDWKGKHWARWGDALAEAGYEPNQWNQAIPEEQVLQSLAALVREHRRFPTKAEMMLKRRSDASFPSETVFKRRFGNRSEIIARVRQYCATAGGLEDVADICDSALGASAKGKTAVHEADERGGVSIAGYVYLMKCGRNQYKIGRTNSPTRRHREVALNIPFTTDLVHSIPTDDPLGIEAYWHRRFEGKRIAGTEFFRLDAADTAAFKRRKFM